MSTKIFNIKVNLVETSEVFTVRKVNSKTIIKDLKIQLELIAGIPSQLQRIMYLDQGTYGEIASSLKNCVGTWQFALKSDMEDTSTLKHHDVVPGAQLSLHIWNSWLSLIQSCVSGNVLKVMSLGVTPDSSFTNPNVQRMSAHDRRECFANRCAVALYVACHRGQIYVVQALLDAGADIKASTKYGRTALHVAAANGQEETINILLENGAGELIHAADALGFNPLQAAAITKHKACARKLFLFQWQKRAVTMPKLAPSDIDDLMAHQLYDSTSKTWLRGRQQQMYQSHILPPQEFQGTRINSKRSEHCMRHGQARAHRSLPIIKSKATGSKRWTNQVKQKTPKFKQIFFDSPGEDNASSSTNYFMR